MKTRKSEREIKGKRESREGREGSGWRMKARRESAGSQGNGVRAAWSELSDLHEPKPAFLMLGSASFPIITLDFLFCLTWFHQTCSLWNSDSIIRYTYALTQGNMKTFCAKAVKKATKIFELIKWQQRFKLRARRRSDAGPFAALIYRKWLVCAGSLGFEESPVEHIM